MIDRAAGAAETATILIVERDRSVMPEAAIRPTTLWTYVESALSRTSLSWLRSSCVGYPFVEVVLAAGFLAAGFAAAEDFAAGFAAGFLAAAFFGFASGASGAAPVKIEL